MELDQSLPASLLIDIQKKLQTLHLWYTKVYSKDLEVVSYTVCEHFVVTYTRQQTIKISLKIKKNVKEKNGIILIHTRTMHVE